jgi:integrase
VAGRKTAGRRGGNPALYGKNVERRRDTDDWFYKFRVNGIDYGDTCNTKSKAEAERLARDLKAQKKLEARKDREAGLGPMTFRRACDLWWGEEGNTNVETGLKFRLDWLRDQIGDTKLLAEITISDITNVKKQRARCTRPDGKDAKGNPLSRPLKPKAVNATLVTLRTVINHAGRRHGAAVKMFNWPDFMNKDVEQYDVRVMSDSEQTLIWPELDDDVREVLDFDLRCGKRINEILPLTWPQVDFDGESMRVKIKGRSKPIIAPLGKALLGRLQRLKARKLHESAVFTFVAQRTRSYSGQPYVAGRRYQMKYSYLEERWREACERVGISDLNIHCIRHTAATRLYRATGDIYKVSEMLNHRDIATTKRYYLRTNPDVVREATDVLDQHEQKKVSAKVSARGLKIVS